MDLLPDGEIDFLYCAPEARGVADLLYLAVTNSARTHGIRRLTTQASLFAESFFKRHGWRTLDHERIVRSGVTIVRARMTGNV